MRILIIAPHADDEIIGVGGTILKNIKNGNDVFVCIVTKGVHPLFSEKYILNLRQETKTCHSQLGLTKTFFLEFPSVVLNEQHKYVINKRITEVIEEVRPEEVYIPHAGDMHSDHQIVAEACMVSLRPKYSFAPTKILAYETLSETGWNIPGVQNAFIPNVFVDIGEFLEQKKDIMSIYASQLGKFPDARSLEAIDALAKYRGALINKNAAEAFMLIREIN